ncbi:uncharacterized protein LOC110375605 [Helicoverpa armigera]|uniref:uncharacterized protein LOC110375605 n=1 Tax=Helicoverpa armigera TaxID=29058 RepID=UPI00308276D2
MERDGNNKTSDVGTSDDADSRGAVNALILDYYKKFGRKRDLEQYFSLSTAQSDIKDTSGVFWRKMKSENDSSDSGGRKSDSSHEVCRISIRCAVPEQSSSQEDEPQPKSDSPQTQSPPIIIEEMPANVSRHTDDDSFNYDDNNSHKSLDVLLDLSAHKPHSPTSSITSQRKLEWDSLADVGYANESDRKTSASSLSTLERLALKQQYTNNDTKQDIGPPTAHSTPLDENDSKSKGKKGIGKKTTKIYKKDVDFVEVNVPHTSDTGHPPSINVNLTKHISFNVERDGGVTVDNVKNDISVSPEKVPLDNDPAPSLGSDKQMQTSLTKEKSPSVDEIPKAVNPYNQKIPIMICLNTLRKRLRRKKSKNLRRKLRIKKSTVSNIELPSLEKSGEQVSEAESFEYMPGHMYNQNQNQMKDSGRRPDNSTAGNKSSLESTGPSTTESSKGSKHSLTKDLEKCVDLLKVTLQDPDNDGTTKKRLIKDIVHRLVNAKYRDDDTPTEFLSGISFNSKIIGVPENVTTTSTSDANATENYSNKKPKKSILRNDKFNPNAVASTSQSAPNLFSGRSEKVSTNLMKTMHSTDSDVSSRGKTSSENAFPKTSSEELYLKYLEALRREEAYKRHLKDKELFLKQKLVSSETAFKVPIRTESKISSRLKDLMKDLTRNNYDDGSGDASKLEGGSSNMNFETLNAIRNQRSHSVFTLSSSHSECQKRPNLKKKMQTEREVDEAGPSKHHYCCCPHHYLNSKVAYSDSSVQVNIKSCEDTTNEKPCQTKPKPITVIENRKKAESPRSARVVPDSVTGEIKYVCLCNGRQVSCSDVGDSFMIYKCSKLTNRGVQLEDPSRLYNTGVQCGSVKQKKIDDKIELIQSPCQINTESSSSDNTSKARRHSKSSQTNMVVNMCMGYGRYCNSSSSSDAKNLCGTSTKCIVSVNSPKEYATVHEATRCLQTEISINPQISDPTLSDINIINDCDCAQLISEMRKKIHKSDSAKTFTDVCTNSVSEKLLITSEGSGSAQEVKTFNSIDDKESHLLCTVAGRKYHLPILDTNMTLTLNLEEANRFKDPEYVNQGIGTEKVSNIDEAISVNEECKSTQCTCEYCPNQSNKRVVCVKDASVSIKSCMLAKKNNNFNTFPKKEAVPKEKTPFKRSNTDEGKLSICSCIQTVTVPMRDAQTYNNQPDDSNYALETQVSTAENGCQADPIKENVSTEVSEQSDKATPTSSQHQHENVVVFNIKTDKIDDAIKPDSKNFGNRKDLTFERKDLRGSFDAIKPDSKNIGNRKDLTLERAEVIGNFDAIKTDSKNIGSRKDSTLERADDRAKDARRNFDTIQSDSKNIGSRKDSTLERAEVRAKDARRNFDAIQTDSKNIGSRKDLTLERSEVRAKEVRGNFDAIQTDSKNIGSRKDLELERAEGRAEEVRGNFDAIQTDSKNIGSQKDLTLERADDRAKDVRGNLKDIDIKTSNVSTKSIGVVTMDEKKVDGSSIACQTDAPTNEKQFGNSEIKIDSRENSNNNILRQETCCYQVNCPKNNVKGPVIEMIQDITRRYSKTDLGKVKKKKCVSEIMTVLNYLLETEDSTDPEPKTCCSTTTTTKSSSEKSKTTKMSVGECVSDRFVDKSVQLSCKKACKDNNVGTESSDLPCSSDQPTTSSDSAACRVLNKIKKECEKYHQKVKCKGRKCEVSSSTSVNCEKCKKVHHCACRYHKCKRSKTFEKLQKKCIAYNLIIQTSESMLSEETVCENKSRALKNIIVKVPKRKGKNEVPYKTEFISPPCSPKRSPRGCNKSKSGPIESETSEEYARRVELATVREYLEQNRPDFVQNTEERRHCLKFISAKRADERASKRNLLSLHVEQQPDLTSLNSDELRQLAQKIGLDLRKKKPAPKFLSEREMKKHSERIYKTLPEVVQKKEEKKKENIKKTNLLMANMFKKNLQKQALRGAVSLSNYSTVIKI